MTLSRRAKPWLVLAALPILGLFFLLVATRGLFAAQPVPTPASAQQAPHSLDIEITKTVGTAGPCPATRAVTVAAGVQVIYCFTMRNVGSEFVDSHDLVDSHLGMILGGALQTVPPGGSMVVTSTYLASVSVTNVATWTAWQAGGPPTQPTDVSSATLTVLTAQPPPSIVLTKTVGLNVNSCANSLTVVQGTQVVYCYRIKNTGTQPLRRHSLTDAALGPLLSYISRTVAPGETTFVTTSAVANVSSNAVATWTAWITGTPGVFTIDTDSATLNVTPRNLALQLTKTVGKTNGCATTTTLTVNPGQRVVYCYKIKNNSNVTLTSHKLVDSRLGTILTASGDFFPGDTRTFTVATTLNFTTTNTATWTSGVTTTTTGVRVFATASAVVKTPHVLNLTFAKTVGVDPHVCSTLESASVLEGLPAFYCYRATNSGNVPLRLHTLQDAQFGVLLNNLPFTLSVGASVAVTKSFTADITRTTVATWTAYETTVSSPKVRRTDTATIKVLPNPALITLGKTVGVTPNAPCPLTSQIVVPAGTTVYYCYAVQNTGTITLPKHQLYDDDLAYDILPAGFHYDLKPGEVVDTRQLGIEVSRRITKTTTNFAIWQSYINDVLYAQDSANATVTVRNAQIEAKATVGAVLCDDADFFEGDEGDPYSLCLLLRNSGEQTLTHHTIVAPALGIDADLDQAIAPGSSLTVTRNLVAELGPHLLAPTATGAVTLTVTSTANPDGAPFTATAQDTITLFISDATQRLYLPAAQR